MSRLGSPNMGEYRGAMSFQEIADAMGISKQLVWFYYVNAIKKLRQRPQTLARLHELALALDRERQL